LSVGFGQSTSLITTFTNPTPASYDYFGFAIAAVSDDTVVIGAPNDSLGVTDAGAAYLFATNGTLLTTFANPDPVLGADFGSAVATVGGNRVLNRSAVSHYRYDSGWNRLSVLNKRQLANDTD
jgi:hypothetical protein